jgi:PhnB protein
VQGAAEAIEFYERAFGAEERGPRAPGPNNTIMHAEIKIGNSVLMISDAMTANPTQSFSHLYVEDVDAWWQRATAAGAHSGHHALAESVLGRPVWHRDGPMG